MNQVYFVGLCKSHPVKVQEIIPQFFYQNKTLTLKGIGHFELDPSIVLSEKIDPGHLQSSIHFRQDKSAGDDETLIDFVRRMTGKMRPLAISDIETFLNVGKELLNIGKPFIIKGIGSLIKNQNGDFEFSSGEYVVPRLEMKSVEYVLTDKTAELEVENESAGYDFTSKPKKSGNKWLVFFIVLILLGAGGWAAYNFFLNKAASEPAEQNTAEQIASSQNTSFDSSLQSDTTHNELADSVGKNNADSTINQPVPVTTTPATFRILIETTRNRNRALSRYSDLKEWGHKVQLETQDSVTFRLYIPVNAPLSDTTKARDSLSAFFGRKTYVRTLN